MMPLASPICRVRMPVAVLIHETLARKTPVLGNDFAQIISSQIGTWRAADKRVNVEVIA
jgi:hypothetical protein